MQIVRNPRRPVAQIEYGSVIVSLLYAMHYTRPDIAFIVYKLSKYINNPNKKNIGKQLSKFLDI